MTDQQLPNAGVARRLAAIVYDSFLVFGLLFVAVLIPSVLIGNHQPVSVDNEQVIHQLQPMLSGIGLQLYLLTVGSAFFCWFWHNNGQTLAMQAWRLRIETMDGNKPGWGQCLLRLLAASLSIAALGAGYWWIWIDKDQLSWHDRLSKTRLVVLPKKNH